MIDHFCGGVAHDGFCVFANTDGAGWTLERTEVVFASPKGYDSTAAQCFTDRFDHALCVAVSAESQTITVYYRGAIEFQAFCGASPEQESAIANALQSVRRCMETGRRARGSSRA